MNWQAEREILVDGAVIDWELRFGEFDKVCIRNCELTQDGSIVMHHRTRYIIQSDLYDQVKTT